METPANTTHKALSPATATAIVGGSLVIVAIIALVSANWGNFNSWARIGVLAAPLILLYLTGGLLHNKEHYKELALVALLTANIAFPFVIGVTYYELAGRPGLDAGFYAVVLGITSLWYVLWEFIGNLRENTILTLASFTFWLLSITATFQTTPWINSLAVLGVAILTLLASVLIWSKGTKNTQSLLYSAYGIVMLTFALFYAPQEWSSVLAVPELREWFTQLGYLAIGLVFLSIGTVFASAWHRTQDALFFHSREMLEGLGIFGAVVLTAFTALFHTGTDTTFLLNITTLVIALLGFTFSYQAPIKGLRSLSTWAGILVLIRFIYDAFSAIDLSWPLLILVVGILLFGLAIVMASRHHLSESLTHWYKRQPEGSWYGLGERLEVNKEAVRGTVTSEVRRTDGTVITFMNAKDTTHTPLAAPIILIFIGLIVCLALSSLIFGY